MDYAVIKDNEITQVLTTPFLYIMCGSEVSDATHFFNTREKRISLKKDLSFRVDIEGLKVTLTGIAPGVRAETDSFHTVTDLGPLVITYDLPGKYEITLSDHVEYRDEVLEVTVGDT